MVSGPDQSNELSVLDSDDGSISPGYFKGLTVQLEYFAHLKSTDPLWPFSHHLLENSNTMYFDHS